MRQTINRHAGTVLRRLLLVVVATIAMAATAAPALASGGGGGGGGTDFSFSGDASTTPGFLVSGGLATCPAFDNCGPNPSFEPRYFSCGFDNCGYGNAFVVLTSLHSSGTVKLAAAQPARWGHLPDGDQRDPQRELHDRHRL